MGFVAKHYGQNTSFVGIAVFVVMVAIVAVTTLKKQWDLEDGEGVGMESD